MCICTIEYIIVCLCAYLYTYKCIYNFYIYLNMNENVHCFSKCIYILQKARFHAEPFQQNFFVLLTPYKLDAILWYWFAIQ